MGLVGRDAHCTRRVGRCCRHATVLILHASAVASREVPADAFRLGQLRRHLPPVEIVALKRRMPARRTHSNILQHYTKGRHGPSRSWVTRTPPPTASTPLQLYSAVGHREHLQSASNIAQARPAALGGTGSGTGTVAGLALPMPRSA